MIASRDGEAVAVHRARNAAASPLRYEIDGDGAVPDPDRDRGGRARPRRDLPLAHALGPAARRRPTSTSPFYPEALYVIVGVKDRRAPTSAPGRSSTAQVSEVGAGGRPLVLVCPSCATGHEDGERFCARCGVPLRRRPSRSAPRGPERHERARKIRPQYAEGPLVKVVGARNQAEAELLQGMLLEEGVPSLMRRSGGFDVPDFLASGPRDILVPASGATAAREILQLPEPVPRRRHGAGRGHARVGEGDGRRADGRDPGDHRRRGLRRGLLGGGAVSRPATGVHHRSGRLLAGVVGAAGRLGPCDRPETESHGAPMTATTLPPIHPPRRPASPRRLAHRRHRRRERAWPSSRSPPSPPAPSRSGATPQRDDHGYFSTGHPPLHGLARRRSRPRRSTSTPTSRAGLGGDDAGYGDLRLRVRVARRRPGVRRHRAHGRRRALPRRRVPHRRHRHRHRPVRRGVRRARRQRRRPAAPAGEDIWVGVHPGRRPSRRSTGTSATAAGRSS